jgi:hypothetical protein
MGENLKLAPAIRQSDSQLPPLRARVFNNR